MTMSDTEQRMRTHIADKSRGVADDDLATGLGFLADEVESLHADFAGAQDAIAALRAENETLRSDLRELQAAVAELTHATTEAFDNCHAAQRAYTDRAVGERPAPGSTFERMGAHVRAAAKPVLSPSLEFRLEQSIRFLAAELDQVRR